MAQRYLPAIKDGDKRILIIDGAVVPFCLARIPAWKARRAAIWPPAVPAWHGR
jgi:glutathione synthase/RimK-type ligase-like ATP-grasp enzyme